MSYYLDFERPVQEVDEQIAEIQALGKIDESDKADIDKLLAKRKRLIKSIYSNLTQWQRVQMARHPERPYSLDYIHSWSDNFIELHGDRYFADDHAVVCGFGELGEYTVVYIGQQKGRNLKENLFRNFGMMRPEGYRKARRIMKLAEKFNIPVISLIDTQGAYPGIGAEERGQAEAIAKNLMEMSRLRIPIIAVVIGEGASGGALGIGVCDRMLMLENTWFSVISPEGCASILWHDASKAKNAAEALKLIPEDLEKLGICDRIIEEPFGGAHRNPQETFDRVKDVLLEELKPLLKTNRDAFLNDRIERYSAFGEFTEKSDQTHLPE
ncbi:MAG: acetyl-CoA carboxylase carboxyltransferase subunit alpha [Candidatus Neomarinimicrobiota bacterium]